MYTVCPGRPLNRSVVLKELCLFCKDMFNNKTSKYMSSNDIEWHMFSYAGLAMFYNKFSNLMSSHHDRFACGH